MLGHQGVLVDEDCILGLDLRDAAAGPGHVDRAQVRGSLAAFLPSGDERVPRACDLPTALRDHCVGDVPIECRAELGQCGGSHAGHRDIARKAADRVAGEQRIDADMDYLAVVPRRLEAGDPGHIAFEDDNRVGTVEVGARVIAEMGWMIGGKAKMARTVLHDRDREALREIAESFDRGRIAPGAGGHDQRVLGRCEDVGSFVDRALVGAWRGGGEPTRRHIIGEPRQRRRQHFARQ